MNSITLNAFFVIEACQKYLEARQVRIEAAREPLIQGRMKGIFGLFKKTREQAIESFETHSDWDSDWERVAWRGKFAANDVQLLLGLAEVAKDHNSKVTIDSETAEILREYL